MFIHNIHARTHMHTIFHDPQIHKIRENNTNTDTFIEIEIEREREKERERLTHGAGGRQRAWR